MCDSIEELIKGSQALIIGQNNQNVLRKLYSLGRADQFILDLVGEVEREKVKGRYQGICW